jgi:hypothetical protein
MNDTCWLAWPVAMKAASAEHRQAFDAAMLTIIAELQLTSDLQFSANAFFDALLGDAIPHSRVTTTFRIG